MINILHIGLSSNPGGVENLILNYSKRLNRDRFKFHFLDIYGEGIAFSDILFELDYNVHIAPNYKTNTLAFMAFFIKLLRRESYEIIHIHMQSTANILPIFLAKVFSNKSVIIAHSHSSSTPNGFLRKVLDLQNRFFLRWLNINKWACGLAAGYWMWGRNFKTDNIIPNAIDKEIFSFTPKLRKEIRQLCGFDSNHRVIGFVGRFGDEKNTFFLLDILSELLKYSSNYRLLTIGDGELYDDFMKEIMKKSLQDYCYLAGRQKYTYPWFQAMDVFLLPSLFEGFPVVAVEAQSIGVMSFLSNKISSEINISDKVRFLPLNDAKIWASEINDYMASPLPFDKGRFNDDYKIENAINILENKYSELLYGK